MTEGAATGDEFDHEPTREFDPVPEGQEAQLPDGERLEGERTRIHANTIQAPDVVDDEFDHSETTSKKPRPDGLDDHDGGDGGGESSEAN